MHGNWHSISSWHTDHCNVKNKEEYYFFRLDADLIILSESWITNKKSVHKGEQRGVSTKMMVHMPSSNDVEA